MTGDELRTARWILGKAWDLGRPLTLDEMARILRLAGKDPAGSLHNYERGNAPVSGPLSLAVELLIAGGRSAEVDQLLAG